MAAVGIPHHARTGRFQKHRSLGGRAQQPRHHPLQRVYADRRGGVPPDDIEAQRQALNRMMGYSHGGRPHDDFKAAQQDGLRSMGQPTGQSPSAALTGAELRKLVYEKWGKSYDVRLIQRSGRMYLHVMWKYLEQQSFPMTDTEYQEQLDAIAEYITLWGVGDIVRDGIGRLPPKPPHVTRGTGKAIQIILGTNLPLMELES